MLLELDAGNSRIKWRVSELSSRQGAATVVGAVQARGAVVATDAQSCIHELLRQMSGMTVQRILVSSVRTKNFSAMMARMLNDRFSVAAEFAGVQASFGAVRNAYQQSERLGVDRWLAVIAAYARAQGACCVLDCGTTITLDVVAANGQHVGGYIVPGLLLLRETLGQRSAALQVAPISSQLVPGTSTEAAIANGVLNMALGFIRDQHLQLSDAEQTPLWYLTGGDAQLLASYIEWPCQLLPDLVLDGLRQQAGLM